MNFLAWLALGMLSSLITLHAVTRLGARDVRRWIAASDELRLKSIGLGWQAAVVLVACVITLAARPSIMTMLGDDQFNAFMPTAQVAIAVVLCGVFAGLLVTLSRIDLACRLLPDPLTVMLIVTGLTFHALVNVMTMMDAVIGAAAGYGVLWLMARLFKQMRDVEAMGRGDFAMTAGLGAWLGWQSLPLMLTIASLAALMVIGLGRLVAASQSRSQPSGSWTEILTSESAFGPALAFGGLITWVQLG